MIYVRLAGGLGNQLFQIAAAALWAKSQGTQFSVLTSGLGGYATKRSPDVLRLINPGRMRGVIIDERLNFIVDKLRVGRWLPLIGKSDKHFPEALATKVFFSGAILDGYFQRGWSDALLFSAMQEMNLQCSTPPGSGAYCVMHIRGGDFLKHDLHNILSSRYYANAVQEANGKGIREFRVITDDPSYSKKIIDEINRDVPGSSYRMNEPSMDPLDDFLMIRNASNRIIGNSTFAWWASALGGDSSVTWSPDSFLKGSRRDYATPWENILEAK